MKNFWNILSWIAGIGLIISLYAFSGDCQQETRIKSIQVEIEGVADYPFITQNEVMEILYSEYPFLDSLYCREINKSLLEESLDNHPSIHKAEVYSTLTGILWINISQKRPVFRVQHSDRAYYVDAYGSVMPLSPHYSAEVPLVTGHITPQMEHLIYEFFTDLEGDEFFDGFFHGVDVAEDGTWTLYPELGNHQVLLGEPKDVEDKLSRLQTFYMRTRDTPLLDEFKSLNLMQSGQVVGSKR